MREILDKHFCDPGYCKPLVVHANVLNIYESFIVYMNCTQSHTYINYNIHICLDIRSRQVYTVGHIYMQLLNNN